MSAFERGKILRKAADLVRARADEIAKVLTQEQGKILAEAKLELISGADIIDWFAGEGQRAYGRIIPARADGVRNMVILEPIGPVAGFSPWNFPVTQAVRKIAASLAAGCSIIIKCPEETPGSPIGLVKCFHDAGVPAGVINLVYGVPAEISEYLIPSPIIRKVSFTGSVPVGKHLNALAASHMKRATMELGGHAPVLVFDDADVDGAAKLMGALKYRNAGQVCVSPTRFFVQEKVYDKFVSQFIDIAKNTKVGDGLEADSKMGPLANPRRINAIEGFIADAQDKGAKVATGGKRIGNQGNFFQPTVLTDVPDNARIMNEEPFGPVAVMLRFKETDDVLARANKLPFGLASYAFTKNANTATKVADALESGMVTINHFGIALPETPFGGVKDFGLRPRRRHRGTASLHAAQVHQPPGVRRTVGRCQKYGARPAGLALPLRGARLRSRRTKPGAAVEATSSLSARAHRGRREHPAQSYSCIARCWARRRLAVESGRRAADRVHMESADSSGRAILRKTPISPSSLTRPRWQMPPHLRSCLSACGRPASTDTDDRRIREPVGADQPIEQDVGIEPVECIVVEMGMCRDADIDTSHRHIGKVPVPAAQGMVAPGVDEDRQALRSRDAEG